MEWNQPWDPKKAIREPVHLKGEIIQIGAVKLDERFGFVDTFKVLISPRYYKKMHSKVSKLTKIKTSTLKDGSPFEEAFESFKSWCGDDFVFLVWGWDDIPMLWDNMTAFGADTNWLPKWYNVQSIYDAQIAKEGRQHALSDAMEKLGETLVDAHDAFNDAYGTALVCRHLDMEKGIEDYAAVEIKRKIAKLKLIKDYPSNASAQGDAEMYSFKCPVCTNTVTCGEMITYKRNTQIGIVKCSCGEEFFIRIRSRRIAPEKIRYDRTVTELDDEKRTLYDALTKEKEPVLQK